MTNTDTVALIAMTALLGEASPSLRGMGISLRPSEVQLFFYYDGPIDERDRESASLIETEMLALMWPEIRVIPHVVRHDAPQRLPDPDRWIYRRREDEAEEA